MNIPRAIGLLVLLAPLLAPVPLRAQRAAGDTSILGVWQLHQTEADNPDLGADTLVATLELRRGGRWIKRTRLAKLFPERKNGRALFIDRGQWRLEMRPDSAGVERRVICLYPSDNLPDPRSEDRDWIADDFRCGVLRATPAGLALEYAEGTFIHR